jgi:glycosyltransferase involved in cell wall biosynthesis
MSLRILLFANTDWYLYNFRIGLARALRSRDHEVLLVSPSGRYTQLIAKEFRWRELNVFGGSKAPFRNLRSVREIRRVYQQFKPDLVHHFTIKCVLFGGMVARSLGIPAVHSVTGLGHVFTDQGLANRVIRPFVKACYRHVLRSSTSKTIFQNSEERDFFLSCRVVPPTAAYLIRGSGADCERFRPVEAREASDVCRVLFASRLLKEKGIFELLEAQRKLLSDGVQFELQVAGEPYPGNPSSLTERDLQVLKSSCKYYGHVDNVENIFSQADVVALPSYAEGTPRVLLEAGACGLPLVGSDIAGCRGVIEHGRNGFLVPVRDPVALAEALRKLIHDVELRRRMGIESRRIVVENFSEAKVVQKTLDVYAAMGLPV